jgi:hypothetical protein
MAHFLDQRVPAAKVGEDDASPPNHPHQLANDIPPAGY